MNKIKERFDVYRDAIEASLAEGLTTQEKLDKAHSDLDLNLAGYVRFQELKTLAVADGTLTSEDTKHEYEKCQRDFLADCQHSKYHPNAKGAIERSIERAVELHKKVSNTLRKKARQ